MNEIKISITEKLQQLQMLMHRAAFKHMGGGIHNPARGQGRILAILRIKPEISQKELSYLLEMSKQALAELLAKLEKNGYITREQSNEDKRIMTVRLTEEGSKTAGDMGDTPPDTANILDCLNEQELGIFNDYLSRIVKRYEELFPGNDYEKRRKTMRAFMFKHGGHRFEDRGNHGRFHCSADSRDNSDNGHFGEGVKGFGKNRDFRNMKSCCGNGPLA